MEPSSHRPFIKIYLPCCAIALILLIWLVSEYISMKKTLALVEMNRAQVINVLNRQKEVNARYRGKPDTPEKEAELAGSENRVRVERRRYDLNALSYNRMAGGFPGSILTVLFKLSDRVPPSDEVMPW